MHVRKFVRIILANLYSQDALKRPELARLAPRLHGLRSSSYFNFNDLYNSFELQALLAKLAEFTSLVCKTCSTYKPCMKDLQYIRALHERLPVDTSIACKACLQGLWD